jgi:hypothetical protein
MGWRFRRSIGIGKFLRVNFSKSGIGFSFGLPGYRISIGSDKKIRRTISIPGSGLYNTEVIGTIKSEKKVCPRCYREVVGNIDYCPDCRTKIR